MITLVRRYGLQTYVAVAMFLIGVLNLPPYSIPLPFQQIWPGMFVFCSAAVIGTILMPFSRLIVMGAQSMMITIGTARALGLVLDSTDDAAIVGAILWGLVAILGGHFDRIVLEAATEELVERGRKPLVAVDEVE